MSGNVTSHLPRFAITPNMSRNISGNKSNIYEKEWSNFDRENFTLDHFSVDWEKLLKIDELNADNSTKLYFHKIIMLFDTYAPLKRINKYNLEFRAKLG